MVVALRRLPWCVVSLQQRRPERKNMLAVGVLVIVRNRDCLRPHAALAVRDTNNPSAGAFATAIAQRDAGRDRGEVVGFESDRQLETGCTGFKTRRARAASHVVSTFCLVDACRRE